MKKVEMNSLRMVEAGGIFLGNKFSVDSIDFVGFGIFDPTKEEYGFGFLKNEKTGDNILIFEVFNIKLFHIVFGGNNGLKLTIFDKELIK